MTKYRILIILVIFTFYGENAKSMNLLEYSVEYVSNPGSHSLLRSYSDFSNGSLTGFGFSFGYSSLLKQYITYLQSDYAFKLHYLYLDFSESYDGGSINISENQVSIFGAIRIVCNTSLLRPYLELGILFPLYHEGSIKTDLGKVQYSDGQYIKSSFGLAATKYVSPFTPYISVIFSASFVSPNSYEGIEFGFSHEI